VKKGLSQEEITKDALTALDKLLSDHPNQIAGIVIEPMLQGAGGMRIFTPGFLRGIKELCQKHQTLLIADEVATGFYRTGQPFACNHEQVSPDIMCLAKGLTGGFLPLAVTLATEKIYEAFLDDSKEKALLHGHSFGANPLGCAAAIRSLELLKEDHIQKNIEAIKSATFEGQGLFANLETVANVRSIGTIIAIDLKSEKSGYLSHASANLSQRCYDQGLFIRPLGNVIYLMPPLCATPNEIWWALELIRGNL
jgi:adenosylmethionine-8-amino-7-oxononanoate aminotransferase